MTGPLKIIHQIQRRVHAAAYGNPLYRMMLDQGPLPERVRLTLADPWPGDATAGQALIKSQPALFENEAAAPTSNGHGMAAHDWLRDLRAVGGDKARRKAQALIAAWLDRHDEWQEESWAVDALGDRLANWIGFYEFYGANAEPEFTRRLIGSMARQLRHLLRAMPPHLTGMANLRAVKGLVYAGLALIDSEKALGLALELLHRQLAAEILGDGGHVSRNPSTQLQALRYLIDIRAALRAAQLEVPHALQTAIERMVPALKFYRHGDGGLALFNGAREDNALWLEAAITLSEARGRVLRRLPQTGYERVTAGRSLLLIDGAGPPPRPHDADAHAGLLGFEFSAGRERLLVNCGAGPDNDAGWRQATAATAAHNCLILDDTNAAEIEPEGGVGHRPRTVTAQRYEQDGTHFVEMAHDGYAARLHATCHRVLSLSADGECLRGHESIVGPRGRDFAVRWHLHPAVQAALSQGGDTALLRTPSGNGWRLRLEGAFAHELSLESSIYCGGPLPRRTLQLKASGRTREDQTTLGWSLTREKKG